MPFSISVMAYSARSFPISLSAETASLCNTSLIYSMTFPRISCRPNVLYRIARSKYPVAASAYSAGALNPNTALYAPIAGRTSAQYTPNANNGTSTSSGRGEGGVSDCFVSRVLAESAIDGDPKTTPTNAHTMKNGKYVTKLSNTNIFCTIYATISAHMIAPVK